MEAPLSFSRDLSANSLGSTQEWHVMHCMVSLPLNNTYLLLAARVIYHPKSIHTCQ